MSDDSGGETDHESFSVDLVSSESQAEQSILEQGNNRGNEVQFDTNIPTTHRYLGKLNNISGYTLYEHGEIKTFLAIHTSTLVLPGFTLPLVMNSEIEKNVMQNYLNKNQVFVLVCAEDEGSRIYKYGVTMEVFESFVKSETLYLKAKGRQRCKILSNREIRLLGGRLQQLSVQILAEPNIISPLNYTDLLTLKRRRKCVVDDYDDFIKFYKYRRYHLVQFANAPWIYDQNELFYFVKLLLDHLSSYYLKGDIPSEPILLSYWFIQNFLLTHQERLKLMQLNTTLERLRHELEYLKMQRVICCATCKRHIALQRDVFAMSKDGVQSNYCNPNGYVYETVTVTNAKHFYFVGQTSNQFSWFPGYAWTIINCQWCHGHLGWQFTSKKLLPRRFFGLARSGIDIEVINDEEETNE